MEKSNIITLFGAAKRRLALLAAFTMLFCLLPAGGVTVWAGTYLSNTPVTDWPQVDGRLILPIGIVGEEYKDSSDNNVALGTGVSGASFVISASSLPAGISIDPASGTLSGTPTNAGRFDFTVTATFQDPDTSIPPVVETGNYRIDVYALPTIIPASLNRGSIGAAYDALISATGAGPGTPTLNIEVQGKRSNDADTAYVDLGPSAGELNIGLAYNSTTGRLQGTVEIPSLDVPTGGMYTYNIRVTANYNSTDPEVSAISNQAVLTLEIPMQHVVKFSVKALDDDNDATTDNIFPGRLIAEITDRAAGNVEQLINQAMTAITTDTTAGTIEGEGTILIDHGNTVTIKMDPTYSAYAGWLPQSWTWAGGSAGRVDDYKFESITADRDIEVDFASVHSLTIMGGQDNTLSSEITADPTTSIPKIHIVENKEDRSISAATFAYSVPFTAVDIPAVPPDTVDFPANISVNLQDQYKGVTWDVIGTTTNPTDAADNPLVTSAGLLSVASNETAQILNIRATSIFNPDVTANVRVRLLYQPRISTAANLPNATVDRLYDQKLDVEIATGNVSWHINDAGRALLDEHGLRLDSGGYITGTPTKANPGLAVEITARSDDERLGNFRTDNRIFVINISAFPPIPDIYVATPGEVIPEFRVGRYDEFQLKLRDDSSATWTLAGTQTLPPGIDIDGATGMISGVPTPDAVGTRSFTVRAENANGSDSKTFSITVTAADVPVIKTTQAELDTAFVGHSYFAKFEVTPETEPPITWSYEPTTPLPDGLSLNGVTGAVTGTPAEAGRVDFRIYATNPNTGTGSKDFYIEVFANRIPPQISTTSLENGVVGIPYYDRFRAEDTTVSEWIIKDGALPPGLKFDKTTGIIEGTPTRAGTYNFLLQAVLYARGSTSVIEAHDEKLLSITITEGLKITTPSLPKGAAGVPYYFRLAADGLVEEWSSSLAPLPAGLSLDKTTGVISGTPITIGKSDFLIRADGLSGAYDEKMFSLEISRFVEEPVITTARLKDGAVGEPYFDTVEAIGTAAITWTASGLPEGLRIEERTGDIFGTPREAGTFYVTVDAMNQGGDDRKVLSITVTGGSGPGPGPGSDLYIEDAVQPSAPFPQRQPGYNNTDQLLKKEFIIVNIGSQTITGLKEVFDNNSAFELAEPFNVTQLASGADASIFIRPKSGLAAGTYTGSITISFNGGTSNSAPLSFTVSGTAASQLSVSPSAYVRSAAPGYSNTALAQTFTIRNDGTERITGLSASVTSGGNFFGIVSGQNLNRTALNPGETATVTIRPSSGLQISSVPYRGTLTIRADGIAARNVELEFTVTGTPSSVIRYGDLDNNGIIDVRDLVLLLRYRALPNVNIPPNPDAADVNADGTVDTRDLTLFLQYFARPGAVRLGPQ